MKNRRPFLPHYHRREFLKLLGVGSAVLLAGDGLFDGAVAATAGLPACVVRPEQTEGPYFVDEELHRSDIRSDPTDNSVKPGVPLHLQFHVSRISGSACAPLNGARVDLWQCDALGAYSDVRDGRFDTRGKKFLRGYQLTDAKGTAQFLTIYPGWYSGRAVHIHFKIRGDAPSRRAYEFTSQLYFDESVNDQVFKEAPYASHRGRRVTNDSDFIFRRGGKELLLTPTKISTGYASTFEIGMRLV
jgi:protocatechuate 3,4-dioxygenase beta subunit